MNVFEGDYRQLSEKTRILSDEPFMPYVRFEIRLPMESPPVMTDLAGNKIRQNFQLRDSSGLPFLEPVSEDAGSLAPQLSEGWEDLTGSPLSESNPLKVLSFTVVRDAELANTFTLQFFHSEWGVYEKKLGMVLKQEVRFQYGFQNGQRSPVYGGFFSSVKPQYDRWGVTLTIEGVGNAIKAHEFVKSDTYKGVSISGIVRQLLSEVGLKEGYIEETKRVSAHDSLTSVAAGHRVWERHNMSLVQFVKRVLCPYAVSALDGSAGYALFIDDATNKAYFMPRRYFPEKIQATQARIYSIFRDRMGSVISFTPDIDLMPIYTGSGGVIASSTIDPISKEIGKQLVDPRLDMPVASGDRATFSSPPANLPAGKGLVRPADGLSVMRQQQQVESQLAQAQYNGAQMELIGDPGINPLEQIEVVMLDDHQIPLYTSGSYMVKRVTDNIGPGSFTTSLELLKNAGIGSDPVPEGAERPE